jgi:hypothetical protein
VGCVPLCFVSRFEEGIALPGDAHVGDSAEKPVRLI